LEVLERVLVNNNSSPTTKQYTITAVIKLSTRFHSPNSQMYAEFNLLRFTIPICCLSTRRTILFVGHTHTHPFNGPLFVTMQVSRCQKGKAILNFTEARDSEWQWHQPGHMQVCTLLQTDDHASTPSLSFLQAGCPFCRPTNSVKALKAHQHQRQHRGLNVRCRQWLEGRWQN